MSKTFREIHMNGDGFHTLGVYRLFFRAALRAAHKRRADYDEEVRAWYTDGDGRPTSEGGRGYAFPHCIHGMSLWTDYDNICGGCEEGETVIEEARLAARERFLRFNDRWDWVCAAPGDLAFETRRDLTKWAASIFPGMEGKV